ncbi:CGNR zinc finger domain-containing protein [Streptomyces liangshanensis]|uniref:CGNR zinc finger domain-containing protein n=1 Tax=Streptomyces liangshanensis TaxID=2717324 RepID=A0A6G9GWH3_9ACTN|nr:CGNR zinc finger domain-containing protein [Streptomyces liangshanensis]QIQ02554.1 CGNR zinc finger domain-containing protein [Streptomyces liangshanensis]
MAGEEAAAKARGRVPDTARSVVELLNSRPYAPLALPDRLDEGDTARRILEPFGLPGGVTPSPGQLDLVRTVRADLMAIVTAVDAESAERGWQDLTTHSAEVTLRRTFSVNGTRLTRVSGDPLVCGIATTVAGLVGDGSWSRIRVCGSDRCSAVFYDNTRSRTQRWHSYDSCGNRANVAAHRARRSAPGAASDGR